MSRALAALALAALPALLPAACASRPTPELPPPPAAPLVATDPAPTAAPSAAPTVPAAPPPTGPRTLACGETRCRAGVEICCLGKPSRCVPAPPVPADAGPYEGTEPFAKACGADDVIACDDAGDCAAGQTCCEEVSHSETRDSAVRVCRSPRGGRVACHSAELCSLDEPRCLRKDNVCTELFPDVRRCQVSPERRARPRCGKKPCAEGMTCVVGEDGPTCEKGVFRNRIADRMDVIECNRGRDCGEDESCYQNPQYPGRRCDFTITGIDALSEPAYCTGREDCVAYCRHQPDTVPACEIERGRQGGGCACRERKR